MQRMPYQKRCISLMHQLRWKCVPTASHKNCPSNVKQVSKRCPARKDASPSCTNLEKSHSGDRHDVSKQKVLNCKRCIANSVFPPLKKTKVRAFPFVCHLEPIAWQQQESSCMTLVDMLKTKTVLIRLWLQMACEECARLPRRVLAGELALLS